MSDDPSNHAELSLMVGSTFAFTNVPRNFLIVSIIISILGISVLTIEPLLIENSDWEPVEAQIIDTGVSSMWCGDGWWDECEDNGVAEWTDGSPVVSSRLPISFGLHNIYVTSKKTTKIVGVIVSCSSTRIGCAPSMNSVASS